MTMETTKKVPLIIMTMLTTNNCQSRSSHLIIAMQLKKDRSCCEIFESITSMSDVNLFRIGHQTTGTRKEKQIQTNVVNLLRIRPMGVVSKKDSGACMVLSNRASWIFCEAAALLNAAPIVLNMPVVVQNKPSKLKQTKFSDSVQTI